MSQEQAAEQQQPSPEQVVAQIAAYRDGIIKTATENNLSFDVVFNALAQSTASFVYDFNLLSKGELTDENVNAALQKFISHLTNVTKAGLENMREAARAVKQEVVTDVTPKIITEI